MQTQAHRAWLHFFETDSTIDPVQIETELRNAGLQIVSLDRGEADCAGIICFPMVTLQLCQLIRELSRQTQAPIIALALGCGALPLPGASQLLQAGAHDVLPWIPDDPPVEQIVDRLRRWQLVDALIHSPEVQSGLVGMSPAWLAVMRQIVEAAHYSDAPILITGETGTGKEAVARLVHRIHRTRRERAFILVDCTTIVPELSGSEFFGHERGAFTGALAARDGAFALADGGSLFLDEVGELSSGLQAQLLRVVQEHTFKRVGSNTWRKTDFRLICATNRDLAEEQERGGFRRDLYYRLASWEFRLPPLRERREDILLLARHFLRQVRPDGPHDFDPAVRDYLLTREYPGNARDLRHLIFRMAHRHGSARLITVGDIPPDERPLPDAPSLNWQSTQLEQAVRLALASGVSLKQIRQGAEEMAIRLALESEGGSLPRAARRLGVTDRALQIRRADQRQRDQAKSHGGEISATSQ